MSPAPSGIYGVGFRPNAPRNRPPLIIVRRAAPGHARRRAAVVLHTAVRVGKGGNFEKSPVSSMELGTIERRVSEKKRNFSIKFQVDGDMELLPAGC
jgi:hypothetical protein